MFEHFFWYAILFAVLGVVVFVLGICGFAGWRTRYTTIQYLVLTTLLFTLSMIAAVLNNLATGCSA